MFISLYNNPLRQGTSYLAKKTAQIARRQARYLILQKNVYPQNCRTKNARLFQVQV